MVLPAAARHNSSQNRTHPMPPCSCCHRPPLGGAAASSALTLGCVLTACHLYITSCHLWFFFSGSMSTICPVPMCTSDCQKEWTWMTSHQTHSPTAHSWSSRTAYRVGGGSAHSPQPGLYAHTQPRRCFQQQQPPIAAAIAPTAMAKKPFFPLEAGALGTSTEAGATSSSIHTR
jgi:hypothetical protein